MIEAGERVQNPTMTTDETSVAATMVIIIKSPIPGAAL